MANNEIIPQVDIGGLTLKGLATFTPVLAILSADNVVPMAVLQMEQLGSVFHISGKYAARVPDLLQRCSSVQLDRLALIVGWRKGDAASLMAKSAGGQAVALLSVCLLSLYNPQDVGCILNELSRKVLPKANAISSVSQLLDVAVLLSAKLDTLGFGNILAEQVLQIHQTYAHLGHAIPAGFLEGITTDTFIELLHALSRALCEEKLLVRIQGTHGMGYILGLVLTMFPEDTLITIAEIVIQEGRKRSIIIEFAISENLQTTIEVESILDHSDYLSIPIMVDYRPAGYIVGYHCFNWTGWVADHLQLSFLDLGLELKQGGLTACCNVLVTLPRLLGNSAFGRRSQDYHESSNPGTLDQYQDHELTTHEDYDRSCLSLLGDYPYQRMHRICNLVMRAAPTIKPTKGSLKRQLNELVAAVSDATKGLDCAFDYWTGLEADFSEERIPAMIFILMGNDSYFLGQHFDIASSPRSATIYFTALQMLQLPYPSSGPFSLVEGCLIFNGRYTRALKGCGTRSRASATESIPTNNHTITPTSDGEYSDLIFTIRKKLHFLEVRATIRAGSLLVPIDLLSVLLGSLTTFLAQPCDHSDLPPLSPEYEDEVMTTSVIAPLAPGNKIAIVQTRKSLTSQLLACSDGHFALLQKNCCLNCVFEQAKSLGISVIVAG